MGQGLNEGYQKLQVHLLNLVPDKKLNGLAYIEAKGQIKTITNNLYIWTEKNYIPDLVE